MGVLLFLIFVSGRVLAESSLKCPGVFAENMVLQRQKMPVPIWGWATPGEDVTVTFSGQSKTAKTASSGRWQLSLDSVVDWLLKIRKKDQRVMTTIIGLDHGRTDPKAWKKRHEQGCDFFGYAWGLPPNFEPTAHYDKNLEVVREAFRMISSGG